jgi:hypothetical protein
LIGLLAVYKLLFLQPSFAVFIDTSLCILRPYSIFVYAHQKSHSITNSANYLVLLHPPNPISCTYYPKPGPCIYRPTKHLEPTPVKLTTSLMQTSHILTQKIPSHCSSHILGTKHSCKPTSNFDLQHESCTNPCTHRTFPNHLSLYINSYTHTNCTLILLPKASLLLLFNKHCHNHEHDC